MPPIRPTPAPNTKPAPVDAFGCAADKLNADQSLAGTDIQFYRKSSRQPSGQIEMPATERGFVAARPHA